MTLPHTWCRGVGITSYFREKNDYFSHRRRKIKTSRKGWNRERIQETYQELEGSEENSRNRTKRTIISSIAKKSQ